MYSSIIKYKGKNKGLAGYIFGWIPEIRQISNSG